MKIGIAAENKSLDSIVSDKYADCKYLLIVNLNDDAFCGEVDIIEVKAIKNQENDSGLNLAQELIHYDCEAVITGKLEPDTFNLIADACITRYNGAGYRAAVALERMEKLELKLIRNLEGTDECDGTHHNH